MTAEGSGRPAPRFWPQLDVEARPGPGAIAFAFTGDRLLVREGPDGAVGAPVLRDLEPLLPGLGAAEPIHVGRLGELACFALPLSPQAAVPDLPAPFRADGLRALFGRLDPHVHQVAGRAYQIVEWFRGHAFCGRCGSATVPVAGERARACERCGATYFPRINPAVIMLVEHGGKMLLARNRNFRGPFYSALAGFVEPGETLEEAVAREVWEEVGLEVEDVRYFGSQSWPFPSQLMVGFTARARSARVRLQDAEILDARWFEGGDLPELPGRFSIARRLIESFLERQAAR